MQSEPSVEALSQHSSKLHELLPYMCNSEIKILMRLKQNILSTVENHLQS